MILIIILINVDNAFPHLKEIIAYCGHYQRLCVLSTCFRPMSVRLIVTQKNIFLTFFVCKCNCCFWQFFHFFPHNSLLRLSTPAFVSSFSSFREIFNFCALKLVLEQVPSLNLKRPWCKIKLGLISACIVAKDDGKWPSTVLFFKERPSTKTEP